MQTNHYDALIIGFGKGGKTLAQDLAKIGERVILIEKSPEMYGGTCINVACIPTKSLVHNAKFAEQHPEWNFDKKADFYYQSVLEKRELVKLLRDKNYFLLADNPKITVVTGTASFSGSHSVNVQLPDGKTGEYSADKIFINTGSHEIIPSIKGLNDNPQVYTSKTMLEVEKLPQKLVIIGGGYIGLEFASMYASYGSQVTLLDRGEKLIAREDRDVAELVQKRLESRGIEFIFNADVQEIQYSETNQLSTISYKNKKNETTESIEADAVLLAVGRRPNTASLNTEKAGVELTERGGIRTNEFRQTSQAHIWAMGDVVGEEQFTYISLDDERIVLDYLIGNRQKSAQNRTAVPYSVFIDPPLSRVGINETEAEKQGLDVAVASLPAGAIPRARLMNETDGLLKLIVDNKTGKILGCTLFCAYSHEMINIVSTAMKLDADYTFLRDAIFTHPTMSEALNDLAKKINI